MNFQLEQEINVAKKILADLEKERAEVEKGGNKHVGAILFGQIIGKKLHIESLERIAEYEEYVKNPESAGEEKEKHAV